MKAEIDLVEKLKAVEVEKRICFIVQIINLLGVGLNWFEHDENKFF
ncbi:hypothetical protein AUTU_20470 [Aureibacter tunicatorum]|nr:hypothetical protein AUTU_20470 [Aureibacter tunicatorum]